MLLENVTVLCFLASYAVAFVLELTQFMRRSRVMRWGALGFTSAGLLAQTVYLIVRSRQLELPPLLGSSHDWLLVAAWLLIVLYLGIQFWNRELGLGIFCLPAVLVLVVSAKFVSVAPNPRVDQIYWWSMVHASLWAFGILGVVLALIASLMYLTQHYRLKRRRSEMSTMHLFSLERLSRVNWWLVIVSVPLLTLGMISGLWMTFLWSGREHPVNLVSVAFAAQAAIWIAMAMLFGWMLAAKHPTGRIVAWRTMFACAFLLTTLLVIKLMQVDVIHGRDTRIDQSSSTGRWS